MVSGDILHQLEPDEVDCQEATGNEGITMC